MLTELRIQNFAIIDRLDLKPGAGLIILTGETGAGKSIILDAVEMLVGGRADATVIRTDADAALVEGVFHLAGPEKDAVNAVLKREDLLDDPDYVTLSREVRREGRNVARLNGRTVGASLLKEIGASLVDIHGQSEHLSLLDPHAHLGLLDRYADIDALLADYRLTYQELAGVRRELNELRQAQADADRRTEMLTFQAEEIEAARLKPGEEGDLRQERDRLANAESLAGHAQEALSLLDEGSAEAAPATDLVGQASRALASLARIDRTQEELANQAAQLEDTLAELTRSLRALPGSDRVQPRTARGSRRASESHTQPDAQVRRRHPGGAEIRRRCPQAARDYFHGRRAHRGAGRLRKTACSRRSHSRGRRSRKNARPPPRNWARRSRSNWMI